MAKRRTKKEKLGAHHLFTISYQPPVKRQIKNSLEAKISTHNDLERAEGTAKEQGIELVKRDIIKSIVIVSLILALEVVIYLAVHIKPAL